MRVFVKFLQMCVGLLAALKIFENFLLVFYLGGGGLIEGWSLLQNLTIKGWANQRGGLNREGECLKELLRYWEKGNHVS